MPVALHIEKLKVRSLDVALMELTWETDSNVVDVLDYSFQVLRSESGEGPFDALTPEFEDRYIFVDRRVPNSYRFRQFWYKLRVKHKASGDTADFGPVTQTADPDLIAQAIRRLEQTAFTQVIGRLCWLFPRRTFGTRCRNCWDPALSARKRSNCLECYDTGFLRGFLNPIEVWVQIDPVAKAVQLQQLQKDHQQLTTARMTFYPAVKPGDVLTELENQRWRVVAVSTSERLRATIKQELTLRLIQSTDIEYRLPLNLQEPLKDIQVSPGRMFTNPSNLDAAIDEKTPNIFANYPTLPRIPEE
jgi:hypothetical protein